MKKEKESKVFKELRRIRDELLAEEKRVGSDKFWADVHRRAQEFMRRPGSKLRPYRGDVAVVREKRAKYKTR